MCNTCVACRAARTNEMYAHLVDDFNPEVRWIVYKISITYCGGGR